jgi:hypothetical protein
MVSITSAPSQVKTGSQYLTTSLQYLLLLLVFGVGLFGYLLPTLGWGKMIPGDLGDARFNSVILEHLFQWVTGKVPKLWSPQFFYPFENVLAFSDNLFGSAWAYIAARLFGLPREHAFQVWFATGTCLNFWVCWSVLKRMGFSAVGSAAGAFVFAFGLPALHTEGHAQLVYRFAIPLAFAAWYRSLTHHRLQDLFQTGFWCAIQFLCSIYLGIFLVYLLVATTIAVFIFFLVQKFLLKTTRAVQHGDLQTLTTAPTHNTEAKHLYPLLAIIALSLTFAMLFKYQQIAADFHIVRALVEVKSMLPRFGSYLLADSSGLSSWIGAQITDIPMRPEHQMFFGLGVIFLALMGLIVSMRALSKNDTTLHHLGTVAITGIIALLILVFATVMVGENSFYLKLAKLPGVGSIRAVSRIVLVMLLPVGVLVAMGVDTVINRSWHQWLKTIVVVILLAGLTAETVYYRPYHAPILEAWGGRQRQLDAMVSKMPLLRNDSILLVNQASQDTFFLTEIDAMIFAQDRFIKTLNGYSGNTPPGYTYPDPCLSSDMRVNSFFAFVGPSEAKRQQILDNLRTISPEPCLKPTEAKSGIEQK